MVHGRPFQKPTVQCSLRLSACAWLRHLILARQTHCSFISVFTIIGIPVVASSVERRVLSQCRTSRDCVPFRLSPIVTRDWLGVRLDKK